MKASKPYNRMMPIDELNIDMTYQRGANAALVNRIARNPRQDALGSLCVGQRANGTFWIVDGGQRKRGYEKAGAKALPCDIFQSEGPKHEASVFRMINTERRKVRPHVEFKALLCEGDHDACETNRIVNDCGFEVDTRDRSSVTWPRLRCVKALLDAYRRGGEEHLTNVLYVISNAWRDEPEALKSNYVTAISLLLRNSDGIDIDKLCEKLRPKHPTEIARYADSIYQLTGGGRGIALAKAFMTFYNKGLKVKAVFKDDDTRSTL